ncbi:MAG: glycoside hydrolase family 78 protein [Tannerella sp.]|jgi:alpha-L-rhamnosidase|nr:glycoside hydrolase family 78 protein [Tannerella sp.]
MQQRISVDDLRCEYLVCPAGMDANRPRFSWKIIAGERSVYQQAFRIIVSDHEADIRRQNGNCWDSEWKESAHTVNVEYAGVPLASNRTYFWQVSTRINGREIRSKPASFHTGLFHQEDWKAQWLSTEENILHESPLFRKTFSIEKQIKSAFAYATAAGFYELHLNGRKVGDDVQHPAVTDYRKTVLYSVYDVTDMLEKGENAVGVMLGNGAYSMQTVAERYSWHDSKPTGNPCFLLQIHILYGDGSETLVTSGEGWKYTTGPVIFNNIYGGEDYDARREVPGWASAGTDDAGWQTAAVVPGPGGKLKWQSIPVKVTETLTPVTRTHPSPGVYLFDLGQNIAGWWRISAKGKTGQTIRVRGAETLNNALFPKPLEEGDSLSVKFRYHSHVWTDYTLKSDGSETYEPHFFYTGYRYIEVVTDDLTDLAELKTEGRVVRSALENTGSWTSSNDLLNWIHKAGLWAQKGNLVGYPTDCPHREKGAYTGDGQVIAETSMHDFAMASFYDKWLHDMRDAQEPNGRVPNTAPTIVGGMGGGVAWGSACILIPWWMYHYYDDVRILETCYPMMKKYVDYLQNLARVDAKPEEPYIINYFDGYWYSLGEWCSPGRGDCPNHDVVNTFYYYYDAHLMSRIAGLLGHQDDARQYVALSDTVGKAFNTRFFNPETCIYGLDSVYQTYQLLALVGNLVPEGSGDAVLKTIIDDIHKHDTHLNTGIIGTKYLWKVLSDAGYHDLAYSVVTQETYPGYGFWKNNHATTLLEKWEGTDSHNHQMFGAVTEYLYQYLAGIRSPLHTEESRGYRHICLQPCMPDTLRMVEASLQTVAGTIVSGWERQDSRYAYHATIPPNTTATLELPTDGFEPAKIIEDGRIVWQYGGFVSGDPGIREIKNNGSRICLSLESGTYRFIVEKE